MKISVATILLGTAAAVALSSPAVHAQGSAAEKSDTVTYKPPLRGAPLTRVGGGTRGMGNVLAVNVLAPGETGLTTQEKPTIYWFASQPVDKPVEITITSTESLQDAATPVFEITLQPPLAKGIHAFRLADHNITLKPGVEYQWFVAVVRNPAQRSNDVLAGGTIKRVTNSPVQAQIKQASPAQLPALYAEAGIWYDAIDQLSRQISADQSNRQLRERRAALLEQVGLKDAAAFDRSPGS
ncbi:MAG TPA: DUF928 domain-containing protein [Burkholderiales bacterium]|nr:DUF928 domain-containing protein [Burkholderiales bacterium]